MSTDVRTEEQLVVAAALGSRDDFAVLYERYFDPIYDYLIRLTRNRELAADLVQDTFIRAMQKLDQLEQPAAFRGWIYRIARSQALNRLKRERRSVATAPLEEEGTGLNPLMSQIDPDRLSSPMVAAEIEEVAALVWEAAEALDERTYTVLDLTVRHGFDSAEIAAVLDVSPGNAYTIVSRMKDRVEAVIGAYVMARKTDQNCPELRVLVHGVELPPMTSELAKSINRHVSTCDECGARLRKMVAPANVMAAFAAVAAPNGLAADIWNELDGRWDTDGPKRSRRRWVTQTGILAALLLTATIVGVARTTPVADPQFVDVLSQAIDQPTTTTQPAGERYEIGIGVGAIAASTTTTVAPGGAPATTTVTSDPATTTPRTVGTTTTTTTVAPTTTMPPNQAPVVATLVPRVGAESCIGDTIRFMGSVNDPEGTSVPLESILWSSSIDGELGRGVSITTAPSEGAHTITFSAENSQGAIGIATTTIEILGARVGDCAQAPVVTIVRPVDGTNFVSTARVAMIGALATVADDFDSGLVVTWTSNVDGFLATGNTSSLILTAGCTTHVLTASATDSDGATGSATVTITVGC